MDHDRAGDRAPVSAIPRRFVDFTVLTAVAALGAMVAVGWAVGGRVETPVRFWLLALFVLAGELLPIAVPRRHGLDKVTISAAFAFAMLLCAGVLPACAVYAAASSIADLSERTAPVKVVFNAAQYVLSLAGAGAVLVLAGAGPPIALHAAVLPAIVLAAAGLLSDQPRACRDGRSAAGRPAGRALPGRRPRISRVDGRLPARARARDHRVVADERCADPGRVRARAGDLLGWPPGRDQCAPRSPRPAYRSTEPLAASPRA